VKLGTLLLRNAAIGLAQLEAALRNQVLYGGRLGTNLVELGFLDLDQLSRYLSELSGLPLATPELLDDADRDLLDQLGVDEAHRLRAVPLGYLGERTDAVAVAMVEPTDARALEGLQRVLGAAVVPYVVPELRALYYLERHYGTPRRARFVRTARAGSEVDAPKDERRRSQPAGGIAMPPTLTLEPRKRRATKSPLEVGGGATGGSHAVPTALTYGAACERLDTASHRDQIADVLVEYAIGRYDALVVFLIREGNATGWRGYVAPPVRPSEPIERISLPLGGASALQAAHDTGVPFVGRPPAAAKPIETQLWALLGADPPPTDVIVVPITVKQRAVNLVYAHCVAGAPATHLVNELTDLANRAQSSYLRLIRQTRGS